MTRVNEIRRWESRVVSQEGISAVEGRKHVSFSLVSMCNRLCKTTSSLNLQDYPSLLIRLLHPYSRRCTALATRNQWSKTQPRGSWSILPPKLGRVWCCLCTLESVWRQDIFFLLLFLIFEIIILCVSDFSGSEISFSFLFTLDH